jgi:hypothetical protein
LINKVIDVLKGKCCGRWLPPPIVEPMSSSSPHGGAKSRCRVPKIGMVTKEYMLLGAIDGCGQDNFERLNTHACKYYKC